MEKKYWIIVDGKPQGPFSIDDLRLRRDFAAELPVWSKGLSDWTTAGQVEELAAALENCAPEEVTAEEVSSPSRPSRPEQSSGAETGGRRWVSEAAVTEEGEKIPNTYMGWNIAMTLCCCMPMGIAGIIFSSMVKQRWYRGDIEGAKKASEIAAWCLILSIVLGLVSWPFQMLSQLGSLSGL